MSIAVRFGWWGSDIESIVSSSHVYKMRENKFLPLQVNRHAFSGAGVIESLSFTCTKKQLPPFGLQVNRYAFSGGGATIEEHRAKGANLEVELYL